MRTPALVALAVLLAAGQVRAQAAPDGNAASAAADPAPYADQAYDPAAMARARALLHQEHGGESYSQILLNIAEFQDLHQGSYRWDGEAWYGGDINRLVIKTEGEGDGRHLGDAEAQLLYSRAISPYFDAQAGVQQVFADHSHTYASFGVEGLAPQWFGVTGTVFVSDGGRLRARAEVMHDYLITQRWVLQPRIEVNLAADDRDQVSRGLTDAELGLRLRYEITRQVAPYVGLTYERKFGRAGDYAASQGDARSGLGLVVGLRAGF